MKKILSLNHIYFIKTTKYLKLAESLFYQNSKSAEDVLLQYLPKLQNVDSATFQQPAVQIRVSGPVVLNHKVALCSWTQAQTG